MSLLLEAAEDLDAMAKAAREAIDLRLQSLTGDDAGSFWSAVAKLYARGLPEIVAASPVALPLAIPTPNHTLPEGPLACLEAPAL